MNKSETIKAIKNGNDKALDYYVREKVNEQRKLIHEKLNECVVFPSDELKNDFIIEVMSVKYP